MKYVVQNFMLFRMIPLSINLNWSFPTQKLNLVLLLTFFKRTQLKIGFVKIDEIEVCCTEFYALSNDTTLDHFELEFSYPKIELSTFTHFFQTNAV